MTEIFAPGPQIGSESRSQPEDREGPVPVSRSLSPSACSTALRTTVVERCLGLIAVIALGYCAGELSGGHASDFFGVPPAIMILAVVVGGLVMSHGAVGLARLLSVCAGADAQSESESRQLRALCRRGRRLCYAGAWIMVLVSIMNVMSVLDMPSLIGPGLAVCLQAPLFAILLGEVLFGAAEHWCVSCGFASGNSSGGSE